MKIQNLRIGYRLGLGFGIIALMLAATAALTTVKVTFLSDSIALTTHDRYPKTVLAHTIKDELNETARSTRNVLLMTNPAEIKTELTNIAGNTQRIAEATKQLESTIKTEGGLKKLAALKELRLKFATTLDEFLKLIAANDIDSAREALLGAMRPAQRAYMGALDQLIAYQEKLMTDSSAESMDSAQQTRDMVLAIAMAALVASALIAWYITRSITRPVANAVVIARKVADGDLTSDITVTSKDETGQLLEALRDMNDGLIKIVAQVRTGTDTIATATSQIATGNLDLSSRTEEQASSLEETASAMEQLTSTVKQNADNAKQANQLALSASTVAAQGGAVVGEVVQTMNSISESSRKIVDIISVIDGIAFQTNILALNAAVEAARAGEQGRGFAVVASEVRSLAQRSAAAAKEIKTLIDDSVSKVSSGTSLVEQAGSTMNEVVISVKRVTDVVSEITASSQEQSTGIEEVNRAITQMDEVTQQNAALVEEAAAAASALQSQASDLAQLVSVFKLDHNSQQHAVATVATVTAAPQRPKPVQTKAASSPLPASRQAVATAATTSARQSIPIGTSDDWETF